MFRTKKNKSLKLKEKYIQTFLYIYLNTYRINSEDSAGIQCREKPERPESRNRRPWNDDGNF